jgi:hypothetical protein
VIFISTHEVVRKELKSIDIFSNDKIDGVYLVYPDLSLKDEYIKRYQERGNNKQFIEVLDKMFDNWIEELNNESNKFIKIKLNDSNYYISDLSIFY